MADHLIPPPQKRTKRNLTIIERERRDDVITHTPQQYYVATVAHLLTKIVEYNSNIYVGSKIPPVVP